MKKRGWFTRSQLWFLLLVLNACLLVLGIIFLSRYKNGTHSDASVALKTISSGKSTEPTAQYYAVEYSQPESFTFDPNVADSTMLLRLGLAPFQVRSIYRYRAKGGRFSTKDDFRKVYRLTNEQWEHLSPLITIDKKYQLVDVKPKQKENTQNTLAQNIPADTANKASCATPTHLHEPKVYPRKLSGDETIDINTSDSALLCRVPGIGPYYSRQIVRYRNKLGGYISTDQLLQIENFPTEALAWLVVSDSVSIKRLNINKLSIRQLMKHPYIGYYRASAIVDYRRVHGPITNIHVLRNLSHFSEEDIEKLKPYIDFPITESSDSPEVK